MCFVGFDIPVDVGQRLLPDECRGLAVCVNVTVKQILQQSDTLRWVVALQPEEEQAGGRAARRVSHLVCNHPVLAASTENVAQRMYEPPMRI